MIVKVLKVLIVLDDLGPNRLLLPKLRENLLHYKCMLSNKTMGKYDKKNVSRNDSHFSMSYLPQTIAETTKLNWKAEKLKFSVNSAREIYKQY